MIDVVAAVIKKDNKYLIAQRNRNKHFAFHYEFPGGKVDKGETFESALQREIKEELSIGIKIYKKISSQIHNCLLYTSPSPRDKRQSRMPSSA